MSLNCDIGQKIEKIVRCLPNLLKSNVIKYKNLVLDQNNHSYILQIKCIVPHIVPVGSIGRDQTIPVFRIASPTKLNEIILKRNFFRKRFLSWYLEHEWPSICTTYWKFLLNFLPLHFLLNSMLVEKTKCRQTDRATERNKSSKASYIPSSKDVQK